MENKILWHGTGRYKYDSEGNVYDIFQGIIEDGGLVPHLDEWDQKRGACYSISTTRSRAYARLYASLFFPSDKRSLKELFRRLIWCLRFFLTSKYVAWMEYTPFRPHITDFRRKIISWAKKYSSDTRSFIYLFLWGGTDIPNNYPILICIKGDGIAPTKGSRFVDLHEIRSEEKISLEDFKCIEVPKEHISEIHSLLHVAGCEIPVVTLDS
ncbi:hypothetical protein KTR10_01560 [Candidatus Kaiserbacteria bacterium]|nr:hypothetical protein [Candidatus Kaiserbacteria bacterium]